MDSRSIRINYRRQIRQNWYASHRIHNKVERFPADPARKQTILVMKLVHFLVQTWRIVNYHEAIQVKFNIFRMKPVINWKLEYFRKRPSTRTYCIICKESSTGYHCFPHDRSVTFQWMNALGLEEVPGPQSRLCNLHFLP